MIISRLLLSLSSLLLPIVFAQPDAVAVGNSAARLSSAEQKAAAQVQAKTIREVTTALASRAMEGRGTAQPGADRAAKYIASRFARAGLKAGGDRSTYQQAIQFKIDTPLDTSSFKVGDRVFKFNSDFVVVPPWPSAPTEVKGDLVFVGYGVVSDELKRDDLAGINVKGKVVVMLNGRPDAVDAAAWEKAADEEAVFGRLISRGAVGVVIIYESATWPFSVVAAYGARRSVRLASQPALPFEVPPIILFRDGAGDELVAAKDLSFAQVKQNAKAGKFVSRELHVQAAISSPRVKRETGMGSNVIGVIEGTDAKLKTEALVYTAHYDAFGKEADGTIYPGAADNALGVGKLMALAEVFARVTPRPRRSIIFIAVTGEEHGLLGTEHWLQQPTWPIEKVAANINFDGIGTEVWGQLGGVTNFGFDDSDLGDVIKQVAGAIGVEVVADPSAAEAFYESDHYAFFKRGIPALYLLGWPNADPERTNARVEKWMTTDYHMATDTVRANWHWEGARKLAALGLITGMRIANQEAMPAWKASSPYNRPRGTTLPPPPRPQ